jgi:hypothetical protein
VEAIVDSNDNKWQRRKGMKQQYSLALNNNTAASMLRPTNKALLVPPPADGKWVIYAAIHPSMTPTEKLTHSKASAGFCFGTFPTVAMRNNPGGWRANGGGVVD